VILYHGSNCEIAKVDLAMCKPFKDFGQSFYLTTILTQAREMSRKVADRFGGEPVANDDIATLFRTFAIGVISIEELVNGMKSRKLNNQYAFRTEKAVALLQKRSSI